MYFSKAIEGFLLVLFGKWLRGWCRFARCLTRAVVAFLLAIITGSVIMAILQS